MSRGDRPRPSLTALVSVALVLTACGGGGTDDPTASATTLASASSVLAAQGQGGGRSTGAVTLSDVSAEGLLFMREEEQLAHDVYAASAALWDLPVFSNIMASESSHVLAIVGRLDRYGLSDPMAEMPEGRFASAAFQTLYDTLVARSRTGLIEALTVGVEIEELDMRDIAERMASTTEADILQVYENLLRGSRNHLRAFVARLVEAGGSYTPQYISQEAFDEIVSSPAETGR